LIIKIKAWSGRDPFTRLIKNNSGTICCRMYLEHYKLDQSPFAEQIETTIFFAEAERDKTMAEVLRDLRDARPLITLTGTEGTGKSLFCHVLINRLDDECRAIYLDDPVGSFDDLLRDICLEMGLDPAEAERDDLQAVFQDLLGPSGDHGTRTVLIIDEAEKLFLATLERLLRMICECRDRGPFQVLLAGRPGLLTNLEQLSVYCSGVELEDSGYILRPFTEEETQRYLRYRLVAAGLSGKDADRIFTREAVEKIHQVARGNPRMTNILAEESLGNSGSSDSFCVLLDHVTSQEQDAEEVGNAKIGVWIERLQRLWQDRKTVVLVGGGVVACLVLLTLFRGGEEQGEQRPHAGSKAPAIIRPAEVEQKTGEERPAASTVVPKPEPEKRVVRNEPELHEKSSGKASRLSGDELFRQRLAASAKWVAGAYRDKYTIQLMMLSAEQAESRLKEILGQDDYYGISNQLYVLKKKTSPPTLFVFYGTYDSMDAARMSRNQMPLFLRKHHPYALAISDALRKTED